MSAIDITQIVQELDALSASATRVPGLRGRAMVDQERLTKVGEELRTSIPADIQEAGEILKQKESILNQAHLEARRVKEAAQQDAMEITAAAREEQRTRVDETEMVKAAEVKAEETNQRALQESQAVVQDAQGRASRIIDQAETNSATRREGANQYARESLFNLEERLAEQLAQVRRGIDALGLEVETNGASPSTVLAQ